MHPDIKKEKELLDKLSNTLVLDCTSDTYQDLIETVKRYTALLVKGHQSVSTTQLRHIYGEVKKADSVKNLLRLQVRLAYLAGRNESNNKFRALTDKLSFLIRSIKSQKQLENFQEFCTALVAYHKYNEKFHKPKGKE